jgi:hypothetical protein
MIRFCPDVERLATVEQEGDIMASFVTLLPEAEKFGNEVAYWSTFGFFANKIKT